MTHFKNPDGSPITVYLAGPMSGLPNYNFDEFDRIAGLLRDGGYTVLSPADTAGKADHLPRDWYFRMDFAIIANVDYVFTMPGWQASKGARAEVIMATEMGVEVWALGRLGLPIGRIVVDSWELKWKVVPGEGVDPNAN